MSIDSKFYQQVQQLKEAVEALGGPESVDVIDKTALRLEGLGYAPPVIIPIAQFLRLTSSALLKEIDKIVEMAPEEVCAVAPNDELKCQDIRLQSITVQIYYYKKLILLRQGDLEVWDEIDELYVHD